MSNIKPSIKEGDKFFVILRKSIVSKNFLGEECAGKRRGPYICTKSTPFAIFTGQYRFNFQHWSFEKVQEQ